MNSFVHGIAARLALVALIAGAAQGSTSCTAGVDWSQVTAVWYCPVTPSEDALASWGERPHPYAVAGDAALFRDILSRATWSIPMFGKGSSRPLVVDLASGERLLLDPDFWYASFTIQNRWGEWGLNGEESRAAWKASFLLAAPPDWSEVSELVTFDCEPTGARELPDDLLPQSTAHPVDTDRFIELMSRATARGHLLGTGRLLAATLNDGSGTGRLAVATLTDGSKRRLAIDDTGDGVIDLASREYWRTADSDREAWSNEVVHPPSDWSTTVAVRLCGYRDCYGRWSHGAMTAEDRALASTFREILSRAMYRAEPPLVSGVFRQLVVELDDGRRRHLALGLHGIFISTTERSGGWVISPPDRAAMRAIRRGTFHTHAN